VPASRGLRTRDGGHYLGPVRAGTARLALVMPACQTTCQTDRVVPSKALGQAPRLPWRVRCTVGDHSRQNRREGMSAKINALVVLVASVFLVMPSIASSQAPVQEPTGYWLYVDGVWKGGFLRRDDCDAAAAKIAGKAHKCRPVTVTAPPPRPPSLDTLAPLIAPAPRASSSADWQKRQKDEDWEWDADSCTKATGVESINTGSGRSRILGTARQRFEWAKCMTNRGHQLE